MSVCISACVPANSGTNVMQQLWASDRVPDSFLNKLYWAQIPRGLSNNAFIMPALLPKLI